MSVLAVHTFELYDRTVRMYTCMSMHECIAFLVSGKNGMRIGGSYIARWFPGVPTGDCMAWSIHSYTTSLYKYDCVW